MKKLLIIAYWFVPSTAANAKRPFCFARGFLEAGWQVDVLTSHSQIPEGAGESLQHPNFRILRHADPLARLGERLSGNVAGRWLHAALRAVQWPDITLLWSLSASSQVNTRDYDQVLITILPQSMMVLGWVRGADQRWVYDYQETTSPSRPDNRLSPIGRWLMPFYAALQRKILKQTGPVIFATQSYIRDYVHHDLVPPEKTVHVPFFFDDTAIESRPAPRERFIISYFGRFGSQSGGRSPKVFFQSLHDFLKQYPDARGLTEFRFYGHWLSQHDALITEYELQDIVQIHDAVPYQEYVQRLSDAWALLLLASPSDNLLVPSKMLDYFGAQRPVLAFVPSESETYDILQQTGMQEFVSTENDVAGGCNSITRLWQAWKDGTLPVDSAKTYQWSASHQVQRVIELLSD